jgi:O-antigen ligase
MTRYLNDPEDETPLGCASIGAVAAPVLPLALFAISGGVAPFFTIVPLALAVAALHVVILFLPAWVLLSRRFTLSWAGGGALGAVCGALPWLFLFPRAAGFFSLCGLVGGLAFVATVKRLRAY